MIHIDYDNNLVEGIHAFQCKDRSDAILGQWSVPYRTAGDGVVPRSDGLAYFTTEEFEDFWGPFPPREWFRAEDTGLWAQYDLLKVWQTFHPDVRVRNQDDYERRPSKEQSA